MTTAPARWTHTYLERLVPRDNRYEVTSPDTKGLQLRVEPAGRKVFLFRYRWKGTPTRLTLGEFGSPPRMGLADAREAAHIARAQLGKGMNPAAARPSAKPVQAAVRAAARTGGDVGPMGSDKGAPFARTGKAADPNSVASLVDEFVKHHVRPHLRRPEAMERLLEKEIVEKLGDRDSRSITPREVVHRLDEIVARGSRVMANKTAGALSQLYRFGIQRGIVEASPVLLLNRPGGKEKARTRVFSDDELRILLANLDDVYRSERTKLALRVLLYTGQRRGELFAAEWRDIILQSKEWTIRADVAKNSELSIVPLTPPAVDAFERLKKLARGSRYVLPSEDGKAAGDPKPLTRAVARSLKAWAKLGIKEAFGPHDLRRTLRTGLAKLKVEPHIAERVIGHKQRGIVGVYDVHAYIEEKRDALEKWAAHVEKVAATAPAEKAAA
jgi:integrase